MCKKKKYYKKQNKKQKEKKGTKTYEKVGLILGEKEKGKQLFHLERS